jgi:hypothetical protein
MINGKKVFKILCSIKENEESRGSIKYKDGRCISPIIG